jgi:hypothetical protein
MEEARLPKMPPGLAVTASAPPLRRGTATEDHAMAAQRLRRRRWECQQLLQKE